MNVFIDPPSFLLMFSLLLKDLITDFYSLIRADDVTLKVEMDTTLLRRLCSF